MRTVLLTSLLCLLPFTAQAQIYPDPGSRVEMITSHSFTTTDNVPCDAAQGGHLLVIDYNKERLRVAYLAKGAVVSTCKFVDLSWADMRRLKVAQDEMNVYRKVSGKRE